MNERTYTTPLGKIHYWVHLISPNAITLVFLPGLTADHRLFEKQIVYFEGKYNAQTAALSYDEITYVDSGEGEVILSVHGIFGGYDQAYDTCKDFCSDYRNIALSGGRNRDGIYRGGSCGRSLRNRRRRAECKGQEHNNPDAVTADDLVGSWHLAGDEKDNATAMEVIPGAMEFGSGMEITSDGHISWYIGADGGT